MSLQPSLFAPRCMTKWVVSVCLFPSPPFPFPWSQETRHQDEEGILVYPLLCLAAYLDGRFGHFTLKTPEQRRQLQHKDPAEMRGRRDILVSVRSSLFGMMSLPNFTMDTVLGDCAWVVCWYPTQEGWVLGGGNKEQGFQWGEGGERM